MMLRKQQRTFVAILLFLSCSWCYCLAQETVTEQSEQNETISTASTTSPEKETKTEQVVIDHLDGKTNEELQAICADRGFEIESPTKGPLQREDYLEGARRCMTLEKEMNAVIAAHPELAAELDKEIERMQLAKEELEREREEILEQKRLLEAQLKKAGVDPSQLTATKTKTATDNDAATPTTDTAGKTTTTTATTDATTSASATTSATTAAAAAAATPTQETVTVASAFLESFVLLFDRVSQDIRFVRRILDPVLQPIGSGLKILWRYAKPTVSPLWDELHDKLKQSEHYDTIRAKVQTIYVTLRTKVKENYHVILVKGQEKLKAVPNTK
jgi:hypothetical protein